jgi:drug/metabolite transporter (DMT)-like permease
MLETVLGPLWVWLILSERPGPASLTGGALIFAALVTNTAIDLLRPREPARTPAGRTDRAAAT